MDEWPLPVCLAGRRKTVLGQIQMIYIQTVFKLHRMFYRQANPLENDSVRLDDNSVLVGQQKAREKTLFLDEEGRTTTTPIPRLIIIVLISTHVNPSAMEDIWMDVSTFKHTHTQSTRQDSVKE